MELFLKAVAAILVGIVLIQAVNQKEISLVLSMLLSVMAGLLLLYYLEPVLEFLRELETLGNFQDHMLKILLKVLGIGVISQLVSLLCKDSGNAALGQAFTLMGTSVILWLSLPVFRTLLKLLEELLSNL